MAASSSARKKSKQKKNQREGSTLTHLKKPFLYAAACILVFSLVSTPQFWTAVGTASIAVQGAIKSATHTAEPTPTVSSKSPQSTTTGAQDNKIVPPTTKSKASTETPINNPDQLPADSATTTSTPTATTTPTTPPNETNNVDVSPPTFSEPTSSAPVLADSNGDDMETALLKLTHMLSSLDTNISFTTNKTMTQAEIIKRSVAGPFRDDILNELGIVQYRRDNRTGALTMWRQALKFNPASFRVHMNFAQTLFKGINNMTKNNLEKDRHEAIASVMSLLSLRDQCEPHKQTGKKREEEAKELPSFCAHLLANKEDFQDAIYDGYKFMGTVKSYEKKNFEAEAYYKKNLKMRPWDQEIHILLAGVYENMALFGQAKSYYKQCSKLGTSKGGGMIKASREQMRKGRKMKQKLMNQNQNQNQNQEGIEEKKASKEEVIADAYDEMERENLGSVCADRSRRLDERLAQWVKEKGGGVDVPV